MNLACPGCFRDHFRGKGLAYRKKQDILRIAAGFFSRIGNSLI
jgi:hypothetical protein